MEIYLVGGAVRDELMGVKSKDLDYSVVLNDTDIKEFTDPYLAMRTALVNEGYKIYVESPEHYTIRAKAPNGDDADFVLAREEGPYSDGRRPDWVKPGTLMMDLQRRDFSFNAIAKDADGMYIDPHNGIRDIENRRLFTVGHPWKRFKEDYLRMLRALRFAVTKGFTIGMSESLFIHCNFDNLRNVSVERVREELAKMFNHNPQETINILNEYNAFPILFDMGINFMPTLKEKIR